MNKLMFIMIAMMMFSCNQADRSAGDVQQRKLTEEAIKPVIQQLVDGLAKVDSTKVFSLMTLDEDFKYVDPHGVVFNAKDYKQVAGDFWKDVKEELVGKGQDTFLHIDRDNVLWTHTGAMVVNMKDGSSSKMDLLAATMLFRQQNGKWKIAFIQESGYLPLPPEVEAALKAK